jgi:hypothetical protein
MAIEFDGSDDIIDVGSGVSLDNLNPWTVVGWLNIDEYPTSVTSFEDIMVKASASELESYHMYVVNDNDTVRGVATVRGYTVSSSFAVAADLHYATDTWYLIAAIYDSGLANDHQLFRNGVEASYASGSPAAGVGSEVDDAPYNMTIGSEAGVSGHVFDGFMDDLRVYNRRLSQAELQTIHACRGTDNIVNGLVARWQMDEQANGVAASGSGVVRDVGPNGHHGTPSNSPTYRTGVIRSRRKTA